MEEDLTASRAGPIQGCCTGAPTKDRALGTAARQRRLRVRLVCTLARPRHLMQCVALQLGIGPSAERGPQSTALTLVGPCRFTLLCALKCQQPMFYKPGTGQYCKLSFITLTCHLPPRPCAENCASCHNAAQQHDQRTCLSQGQGVGYRCAPWILFNNHAQVSCTTSSTRA